MSSIVNIIIQNIGQETEHARRLNETFIHVACLFETYYQNRYSSLLEVCPELSGLSVSESEVMAIKRSLQKFIEENPSHPNLPSAVGSLKLTRDEGLKDLYLSLLRLNLEWRISSNVFCLLTALEDLGEKVFYTEDGKSIGSRSSCDAETNFPMAKRYLEAQNKTSC